LARRSLRRAVVVQSMNTVWFRRCLQSAVPCTLRPRRHATSVQCLSSTRPPWGARRAAASAQRPAGFAVAPCSPFRLAVSWERSSFRARRGIENDRTLRAFARGDGMHFDTRLALARSIAGRWRRRRRRSKPLVLLSHTCPPPARPAS
jgi:hypothetical protein